MRPVVDVDDAAVVVAMTVFLQILVAAFLLPLCSSHRSPFYPSSVRVVTILIQYLRHTAPFK